ncbi:DUF3021 domain-containing protein [Virgibacillus sp. NKC19-16]|uniref:DUF3021 domain-containing protein n=1 Tax=Virgibacillus salidurans TaxID=2831673 RepID=UPI001F241B81|nr:DUF3021 domain-containing protein [Virgibacillus sp. NKC19-16]UJL46837.1 DUF3021 domain-containing protein [Virgibacillus sp. NKC19-16]
MIVEALKRITAGIAVGGIYTFVVLSFVKFYGVDATVSEIWLGMLGSLVVGIYFGLSSFIFEVHDWSYLKQTVIHFSLSITVYFIIALSAGWVPFTPLAILSSALVWIAFYTLVWTGFYIYFKKVEASLNEELRKKN